VVRLAFRVRSDIEQDSAAPLERRKYSGEGRAIDRGERSENQFGGRHDRPGISGADEAVSAAFADEPCRHSNRRVSFSPH
jgi:hypothetical protein